MRCFRPEILQSSGRRPCILPEPVEADPLLVRSGPLFAIQVRRSKCPVPKIPRHSPADSSRLAALLVLSLSKDARRATRRPNFVNLFPGQNTEIMTCLKAITANVPRTCELAEIKLGEGRAGPSRKCC